MKGLRSLVRKVGVGACLLALLFEANSGVGAQSPATHNVTLDSFTVSSDASGRTVVTMATGGDLLGSLTLMLDRAPDGSMRGEWALVVVDRQDIEVPPPADAPPGDNDAVGQVFTPKGSLTGKVTGGAIALNDDGTLASLTAIQLNLNHGSLVFDGASGWGRVDANISDPQASSGSAMLVF